MEGVMVALSIMNTSNFELKTDTFQDAMETGDIKVLKILSEAAEDVRRAREGITVKAKHVVALLGAKLELETILGCLPTQAAVKKRARELYEFQFNMAAHPIDSYKDWQEAIRAAGLDYLPRRKEK